MLSSCETCMRLFTYQVPTYQALKGMLESVYWKPTLVWIIDAVRVMKKILSLDLGITSIGHSILNEFENDKYSLILTTLGVGIAWAAILALPYAILSKSLPAKQGHYSSPHSTV